MKVFVFRPDWLKACGRQDEPLIAPVWGEWRSGHLRFVSVRMPDQLWTAIDGWRGRIIDMIGVPG